MGIVSEQIDFRALVTGNHVIERWNYLRLFGVKPIPGPEGTSCKFQHDIFSELANEHTTHEGSGRHIFSTIEERFFSGNF